MLNPLLRVHFNALKFFLLLIVLLLLVSKLDLFLGIQRHATGEIVNYIAVDAYRFGEFPWWLHYASTVPLQMCVAIGILFATVG